MCLPVMRQISATNVLAVFFTGLPETPTARPNVLSLLAGRISALHTKAEAETFNQLRTSLSALRLSVFREAVARAFVRVGRVCALPSDRQRVVITLFSGR